MTDIVDHIKALAEKELGRTIPDAEWTPELRQKWKLRLHARSYNMGWETFPS